MEAPTPRDGAYAEGWRARRPRQKGSRGSPGYPDGPPRHAAEAELNSPEPPRARAGSGAVVREFLRPVSELPPSPRYQERIRVSTICKAHYPAGSKSPGPRICTFKSRRDSRSGFSRQFTFLAQEKESEGNGLGPCEARWKVSFDCGHMLLGTPAVSDFPAGQQFLQKQVLKEHTDFCNYHVEIPHLLAVCIKYAPDISSVLFHDNHYCSPKYSQTCLSCDTELTCR
ncbi:uncharacterized protein LOC135177085 [Pogoniulus pusillus]|uniref:uncharacterized protein LOC135177085 n=1 Tax=Pogoniulus pusillus TaxID=488313 RepID=UPI0030B99B6E